MRRLVAGWLLIVSVLHAQGVTPQFIERFDSVQVPTLPRGWISTTNRSVSGDFVTTTSSSHSAPNAVLSTNATIPQSLTSPSLDFSTHTPLKLDFFSARSSTHTAGLLVEASIDDGITFPLILSDTIRNPGFSTYVLLSLQLPSSLSNQSHVRFRWRLVASPTGGTSGTFRIDDVSITTIALCDLALTKLQFFPTRTDQLPPAGQEGTMRATVKNVGSQPVSGYTAQFYSDLNNNFLAEPSERFAVVTGPGVGPSDSTIIEATAPALNAGDHRFIAALFHPDDTDAANDTATVIVTVGATPRGLIVNEIMYEPLTGWNEWIEFYNRGSMPIDIARWRFSDRPTKSGSNSFILTSSPTVIQPSDFVVAAADSSILSQYSYLTVPHTGVHLFILNRTEGFELNNDGDDIVLRDALGRAIDSISYSPAWHHPDLIDTKGRSLERINPEIDANDRRNWSTSPSAAGGTPGRENGIYTTILPSSASLSINPNPFSPDGDGFEDFCIIHYNLPLATSIIRISVFDIKGRLVRRLANGELSGPKGQMVWDGLDDTKQRLRIGPYIVFIESIDGQGGTLATAKAVVVVAAKL